MNKLTLIGVIAALALSHYAQAAPPGENMMAFLNNLIKLEEAYETDGIASFDKVKVNQVIAQINSLDEAVLVKIDDELPLLNLLVKAVKENVHSDECDDECFARVADYYKNKRLNLDLANYSVHDVSNSKAAELVSKLQGQSSDDSPVTNELFQAGIEEYNSLKSQITLLGAAGSDLFTDLRRVEKLVEVSRLMQVLDLYV